MAFLLALTLAAAGAHTPGDAVTRFVQPRSAKDACAQLAPAYRKSLDAQYGPCVAAIGKNPKAADLVLSHVVIRGTRARLQADYRVHASVVEEHFSLVRRQGVWLITGAR